MALRRRRASSSVMSPAARSASVAICLPGMESKVKRAATSAIRPEPLVMTTKLMTKQQDEDRDTDDRVATHGESCRRPG